MAKYTEGPVALGKYDTNQRTNERKEFTMQRIKALSLAAISVAVLSTGLIVANTNAQADQVTASPAPVIKVTKVQDDAGLGVPGPRLTLAPPPAPEPAPVVEAVPAPEPEAAPAPAAQAAPVTQPEPVAQPVQQAPAPPAPAYDPLARCNAIVQSIVGSAICVPAGDPRLEGNDGIWNNGQIYINAGLSDRNVGNIARHELGHSVFKSCSYACIRVLEGATGTHWGVGYYDEPSEVAANSWAICNGGGSNLYAVIPCDVVYTALATK